MTTYTVTGTAILRADLEITVDADTEEEAVKKAEKSYDMYFEEIVEGGDLEFEVFDVQELD